MTSFIRWSTGAALFSMASLATMGCLEDDPNMDGNTASGTDGSAGTATSGPSNGPGGTLDDSGTGTEGETENGPGDTTEGDPVTIYDIQMGLVPEGTIVSLENVIVTSPVHVGDGGVTIQDPGGGPFSGIYLFLFEEVVMGVPLNPGDVISVTGEYTEFFDFSEITVGGIDSIQVTGSTDVPAPALVAPADIAAGGADAESYESVLVRVENVVASDGTNEFGDFHVDGNLAVSNFWLFEQGGQLDVLPGTEIGFLQGPLLYNFKEYKLAPRTNADYQATLVACTEAATPATIYDVQQEMFSPNDRVILSDVVVTTPWNFDGDTFNVQEPGGAEFSGITIFLANADGFVPTPGDVVTICGAYDEFFDQSQIEVGGGADITVTGNGPVPAAEMLSADAVAVGAGAEAWEGVLVQIDGPTVTTVANEFGEWEVDDVLLMSDLFFDFMDWPDPMVDDMFASLTGVMTYSFGNYKLAPRTLADIVN